MGTLTDTHSIDAAHAYRIQRTARLLRHAAVGMLSDMGAELSPEQWILLWRVYELGPCPQRALADPALDDRANITRLLDKLQAGGWVTRTPDPDDGRRKRIRLTETGRARFEGLFDAVIAQRRRLFAHVSDSDLAALERVLDALDAQLTP